MPSDKRRPAGVEPDMWKYVPWDYAVKEWEGLRLADKCPDDSFAPLRTGSQPPGAHEATECPTCGWPLTQRGFVRMLFPVGHRLFGKAICCPSCWPAPFGHARSGYLSDKLLQVAAKWDEVLRERR